MVIKGKIKKLNSNDFFIGEKNLARKLDEYKNNIKFKIYDESTTFDNEEVIFVCVARLSAEKNHLSLLKAFAPVYVREKKAKLVLVGDGPEKERIQEFVRKKGLGKAVFLAGEVSDVSQFLLASDVFILLSSIESLPMSLLEACSSGLPCIVSKVGDMPRVVLHGETGFVCNAQDPVVVSALMAEMIENRPLCQQMGRAARQRMGHYYPAPEKIYLKIYKEIK